MAKAIIIGRLTDDAVLKSTTTQGIKNEFLSFTVVENEGKDDKRVSTFYDCTAANSKVAEYLKKGTQVLIYGHLRFRLTEDKEKGKVYPHLNVSVMDLQLLGGKKQEASKEEDLPEN